MDLKKMLESAKFKALVLGMVCSIAASLGLDAEKAEMVMSNVWPMVCAYLVGQGIADFGKGKLVAGEKLAKQMMDDAKAALPASVEPAASAEEPSA